MRDTSRVTRLRRHTLVAARAVRCVAASYTLTACATLPGTNHTHRFRAPAVPLRAHFTHPAPLYLPAPHPYPTRTHTRHHAQIARSHVAAWTSLAPFFLQLTSFASSQRSERSGHAAGKPAFLLQFGFFATLTYMVGCRHCFTHL